MRLFLTLCALHGRRYASHVLQTLVTRTATVIEMEDAPEPDQMSELDLMHEEVPETVSAATLLDFVCRQFQHYLGDYLVSQSVSNSLSLDLWTTLLCFLRSSRLRVSRV